MKPSNILLDAGGNAYLTDFGIALLGGQKRLTQAGRAMGTSAYMSPEQINNPKLTGARSDIYSVGVLLYQLATGRLPFGATDGDIDFHIKRAHVFEPPPPPRTVNPAIPTELEAVILVALKKDPQDRYQTCADMAEALPRSLRPAAVVRRKPSRRWLWVAVGLLLVLALLILARPVLH